LPQLAPPEDTHFDVASADVDGDYSPVLLWSHIPKQYLIRPE
jgi:hypothetical protein